MPFLISDAIAVPVERVPITSFGAYSSDDKEIQEIVAGTQVNLVSNITNTLDEKHSFVYGTWISENNGTRTPIDWIETSLDAKSSSVFSIPWIPDTAGKYTIEASIWENNETFTAFSAIWQVTLDVIAKDSYEKLVPEPESEPQHNSTAYENCGLGTTLQDGICVVDRSHKSSSDSAVKWGSGIVFPRHGNPPDSFTPLQHERNGTPFDQIQCRNDGLVLIQRYDGSPACVKPVTKQHLIERGWAETKSLDEIYINPDLIKQNIVRIEDGHISLYPENMCASLTLSLPTEQDIQRYKNDENGLNDTNILQITSDDLKEIPNIQELISAVHSIEFPYNKYSSASLDIVTFVEYEFFLMDKAIKKYGDSKGDYFIQIDSDYEERFTDPAKQGFTNHFIAPLIVYNENVYSIDGVYFWTSDEHKPKRMGVYPKDSIADDEKFIMLTEEDMKSVPKIKDAIESIGTIKESISASKGLPEDQWNEYREWFKQKSQDRLNTEKFRLMQYDEELYSVGFSIC